MQLLLLLDLISITKYLNQIQVFVFILYSIHLFVDNCTPFDSLQAYDVADMFKQYLRELPECLVTNKLSETFLAIYQHVPPEQRLEALQVGKCYLLVRNAAK